jgi:hypothetical protein
MTTPIAGEISAIRCGRARSLLFFEGSWLVLTRVGRARLDLYGTSGGPRSGRAMPLGAHVE